MHNEDMKKNQQGISVVVVLVVVAVAGLAAAGGWFALSRKDSNKQTGTVQTGDVKEKAGEQERTTPTEAAAAADTVTVTYTPDSLFTEQEKVSLQKKLVQPNIDYAEQYKGKEGYNPVTEITITKKSNAEYAALSATAKYRYTVKVVARGGTIAEFLFAENDVIEWWLPECYDGQCGLSEGFKAKYPEIVKKLQNTGNTP